MDQQRRRVWRFRGVRASSSSAGVYPPPHPLYEKILTGFLRFAWTPLGSSGGSGPPASYAAGLDAKLRSLKLYYNVYDMKCSKCPPALSTHTCSRLWKFWRVLVTGFRGSSFLICSVLRSSSTSNISEIQWMYSAFKQLCNCQSLFSTWVFPAACVPTAWC